MATQLQVSATNRQIIAIAAPITLALIVPQANFIINNIFLGHFDQQSLATAAITGVYYLIFAAIGSGLNNGLQALISRRAGENRPAEIGAVFNQAVLISLGIAAFGILFTYTIAPLILKPTIHSAETYEMTMSFLRIRIWGLPFLFVYQMRNALLVGINQSKYLVAGTLAETIANIFFDYSLIFGHFGMPKMGFEGAAYASVIAEAIGLAAIYLVIQGKGIMRQFGLFKNIRWDSVNTVRIAQISGPLVFQHAIAIISWVFFYILVEHHGETALAVSNTMRNVFGFFGVFIWAFAATCNSMVSNIIGQGRQGEVLLVVRKIAGLSAAIACGVCVLLNFFPQVYLAVYGQDEAFMAAGVPVLRLVSVAMIMMSVGLVWTYAVTGSGNSRTTFLIEVAAIVVYCIYVYLVLEVYRLSIFWGWASEFLYWAVLFSLSYLYMRSGKWQRKVI